MSHERDYSQFTKRTYDDYLNFTAKILFVISGVLFIGGLWVDLTNPGQIIFQVFVFTDEPHGNSGLFIAAIILLLLGAMSFRAANIVRDRRIKELEEDTQEWVIEEQTE